MAAAEVDVDELAEQTRRRVDFLSAEVQRMQWQQIGAAEAATDAAAEAFVWGLIVGIWLVVIARLARRVRVAVLRDSTDGPNGLLVELIDDTEGAG